MRPGTLSTGFGSPLKRSANARVDDDELAEPRRELVGLDRVVGARPRLEGCGLDLFLARGQRAEPGVEVDHGAVVVPEVP